MARDKSEDESASVPADSATPDREYKRNIDDEFDSSAPEYLVQAVRAGAMLNPLPTEGETVEAHRYRTAEAYALASSLADIVQRIPKRAVPSPADKVTTYTSLVGEIAELQRRLSEMGDADPSLRDSFWAAQSAAWLPQEPPWTVHSALRITPERALRITPEHAAEMREKHGGGSETHERDSLGRPLGLVEAHSPTAGPSADEFISQCVTYEGSAHGDELRQLVDDVHAPTDAAAAAAARLRTWLVPIPSLARESRQLAEVLATTGVSAETGRKVSAIVEHAKHASALRRADTVIEGVVIPFEAAVALKALGARVLFLEKEHELAIHDLKQALGYTKGLRGAHHEAAVRADAYLKELESLRAQKAGLQEATPQTTDPYSKLREDVTAAAYTRTAEPQSKDPGEVLRLRMGEVRTLLAVDREEDRKTAERIVSQAVDEFTEIGMVDSPQRIYRAFTQIDDLLGYPSEENLRAARTVATLALRTPSAETFLEQVLPAVSTNLQTILRRIGAIPRARMQPDVQSLVQVGLEELKRLRLEDVDLDSVGPPQLDAPGPPFLSRQRVYFKGKPWRVIGFQSGPNLHILQRGTQDLATIAYAKREDITVESSGDEPLGDEPERDSVDDIVSPIFQGMHADGLREHAAERAAAQLWEFVNTSAGYLKHESVTGDPHDSVLGRLLSRDPNRGISPSVRDWLVASTVMQWIGSATGLEHVRRLIRALDQPGP